MLTVKRTSISNEKIETVADEIATDWRTKNTSFAEQLNLAPLNWKFLERVPEIDL